MRPIHKRLGFALLVSALLAAGCTSVDQPASDSPISPITSVDEETSDSPPQQEGGNVEILLGAPADCGLNPFCAPGLRASYGVEIDGHRKDVPFDDLLGSLDRGDVNVVVLSNLDPAIALDGRDDLVVLEDDRAMVGPGNIIPVVRNSVLGGGTEGVEAALNAITAALGDEKDLAELIAIAAESGDPAQAARDAVAASGVDIPTGRSDTPLRIGAQSFFESTVLANLYAEALISAGFDAEVVTVEGFRYSMLYSVVFGEVDITPEYLAPLANFVAGSSVIDKADVAAGADLLAEMLSVRDVTVLEPSVAESRNTFVTTAQFADASNLRSLSDMAAHLPAVSTSASPDSEPLVKEGSSPGDPGVGAAGDRILDIQFILLALGFDPGETDGEFGQETRAAVYRFQQSQNLRADGVVGAATWNALRNPKLPIDPSFFLPEPALPPAQRSSSNDAGGGSPGGGTSGGTGGDASAGGSGNTVYLTFDDGPNTKYTPQVLDLLQQYDAKATFFVTGTNVSSYPDLVKRIAAEGHSVQNHTWNHADLRKLDRGAFNSQVRDTNEVIAATIGKAPSCLRPPYGARNDNVKQWIKAEGMTTVLWDIDPQDWRKPGARVISNNIIDHVRDGSVVLLHDAGGTRSQTITALETVLKELSSKGFRFASGCN